MVVIKSNHKLTYLLINMSKESKAASQASQSNQRTNSSVTKSIIKNNIMFIWFSMCLFQKRQNADSQKKNEGSQTGFEIFIAFLVLDIQKIEDYFNALLIVQFLMNY